MNWEEFRNKWIWYHPKKNANGTYSYASVWDMDKGLSKRAVLEKIVNFFKYRFFSPIWDFPGDTKRSIKHWTQRAKRGWSDQDTWSFDWYLARTIAGGLKHLKEHKHGVPTMAFPEKGEPGDYDEHGNHTDQAMAKAEKNWDKILDTMIATFETAQKINDHNWIYPYEKEYFTEEEIARWKKFCGEMTEKYPEDPYKIMTREEVEQYRLGWKYFQQYFFSLWD
jgi:hypothetical protein